MLCTLKSQNLLFLEMTAETEEFVIVMLRWDQILRIRQYEVGPDYSGVSN